MIPPVREIKAGSVTLIFKVFSEFFSWKNTFSISIEYSLLSPLILLLRYAFPVRTSDFFAIGSISPVKNSVLFLIIFPKIPPLVFK